MLLGGHTVRDTEIKFGYAVTGTIRPRRGLVERRRAVGDVLILTKPLGTGIVSTAIKRGARPHALERAAIAVDADVESAGGRDAARVGAARARVHRCHGLWPDRPRDEDGGRERRDDRHRP